MNYSLSNMLGGGMVAGLDPDAKAYVNAVIATGISVTSTQRNAINDFIKAEKDASRYASIKRLYLPIWGTAAANAIDMVTRASGTFVNSPTHGAGFVKGNGSTSYFALGVSPTTLGFTSTSGRIFALVKTADTRIGARSYLGARDSEVTADGECNLYAGAPTFAQALLGRGPGTPVVALTVPSNVGIFCSNRNAATGLKLHRRAASGVTRSTAATGTGLIATQNFTAMALQSGAIRTLFTDAELGLIGVGDGLADDAAVDAFTANLKTLWETCTGLTLP